MEQHVDHSAVSLLTPVEVFVIEYYDGIERALLVGEDSRQYAIKAIMDSHDAQYRAYEIGLIVISSNLDWSGENFSPWKSDRLVRWLGDSCAPETFQLLQGQINDVVIEKHFVGVTKPFSPAEIQLVGFDDDLPKHNRRSFESAYVALAARLIDHISQK
jgi:hypothetical protein